MVDKKEAEKNEDAIPYKPNPPHLDGIGDMSKLVYLEEENVVHNLTVRYTKHEIYTYVSSVLIAVNPYELIDIYGMGAMNNYRGKRRAQLYQLPPHCYAVAEEAYQLLAKTGVNQSMVICGESGSGKTETAKVFMRYLAHITAGEKKQQENAAAGRASIEEQFLQANPILESFGNAQTVRNNNSSRFAKFTQVLFENTKDQQSDRLPTPKIVGSFIETYLLEKSRVVGQSKGERNYHIFYQVCTGLPSELRTEWKLNPIESFHYLNQSGVTSIRGVSDKDNLNNLSVALTSLNIEAEQQDQIFRIVAAILHLGNVNFDELDADTCSVAQDTTENMEMAASLLEIPLEAFKKRLTSRTLKVGVNVITKPLNKEEAAYNRDAMSKAIYQGLFLWIVQAINSQLFQANLKNVVWIGILDVFGFEDFTDNSFEQMCINFANERLQQFFNEHVILSEEQEYLREALPWEALDMEDNQDTIDMMETKPQGLIAILDSTCVMPKGSDAIFVNNLFQAFRKHPRLKLAMNRVVKKKPGEVAAPVRGQREKFLGFTIDHYAGEVTYNAEGFLDKNNDTVHEDTIKMMVSAGNKVAAVILDDGESDPKKKKPRKAFQSVGANFLDQLKKLLTNLKETTPHFVRCINPNQFKQPQTFDKEYVRPQLRDGGLIEALRILKLGFPSRVSYNDIHERYGHLLKSVAKNATAIQKKDFAEAVFLAFGMNPDEYQLGLTKVFFRPGKQEFLEEVLGKSQNIDPKMVDKIRGLMVGKRVHRLRSGVLLAVRFDLLVKKHRALERLVRSSRTVRTIAKAFCPHLRKIKAQRASFVLQACARAVLERQTVALQKRSILILQKDLRLALRRTQLSASLTDLIAKRQAQRGAAAQRIQSHWRLSNRRHGLTAELEKRVAATRKRKEEMAKMADEKKRKEEEAARQKRMEEERARLAKQEEERKIKEAEAQKKREAEEKAKKEAEEKARAAMDADQRRKLDEEVSRRLKKEEEEKKKIEDEELRKLQEAQDKAERKRKAQEREEALKRSVEEQQHHKLQEELERQARDAKAQQEREEKELLERQKALEEEAKRRTEENEALAPYERDIEALNRSRAPSQAGVVKPAPPKGPIPKHILDMHEKRKAEIARQQQQAREEEMAHMRSIVLEGAKFLKYGKRGKPHIKYVAINCIGNLHWDEEPMDPQKLTPSPSFLRLRDVISVLRGKHTQVFKRKQTASSNAPEHLCLSIVTHNRTLDLQAVTVEQRDLWANAIELAIQDLNSGIVNLITREKYKAPADRSGVQEPLAPPPAAVSSAPITHTALTSAPTFLPPSSASPVLVPAPAPAPPPAMPAASTPESAKLSLDQWLAKGHKLLKHGRTGKPKLRWINVAENRLFWGETEQPSTQMGSSYIELADVKEIRIGKTTEVFLRKAVSDVPAECCFSLVLKNRSLDLQADSQDQRRVWIKGLTVAVKRAKDVAHAEWLKRKRQQSAHSYRSITGRSADEVTEEEQRKKDDEAMGRTRGISQAGAPLDFNPSTGGVNIIFDEKDGRDREHSVMESVMEESVYEPEEDGDKTPPASRGSDPVPKPAPAATGLPPPAVAAAPAASPLVTEDTPAPATEEKKEDPDIKKVIRSMARRGSVEVMAAHMRRNMERQANLQSLINKAPGQGFEPKADTTAPAAPAPTLAPAPVIAPMAVAPLPETVLRQQLESRSRSATQLVQSEARDVDPREHRMMNYLHDGSILVKHGRSGKPKKKFVNVYQYKIFWGDNPNPSTSSDSSYLPLASVQEVRIGKTTKVFERNTAKASPEECCLSLVLKGRTLDLEAESTQERNTWAQALTLAVKASKRAAHEQWLQLKRQQSFYAHGTMNARTRSSTLHMSATGPDISAAQGPGSYDSQSVKLGDARSFLQSPRNFGDRPGLADAFNDPAQDSQDSTPVDDKPAQFRPGRRRSIDDSAINTKTM